MKRHFTAFVFFFVVGFFNIYGQADCRNALPICVDANNDAGVSGIGKVDDFLPSTTSGCLGAAGAGTVESNSYWFRIKLTQAGQFGFDIIPNDPSEDWDFAVYGPNAICGQLPDPIKCNKIQLGGTTGVGNAAASNLYDSWMTVAAEDEYLILVNQFSGANAGFKIKWTGSISPNPSSALNCSIQVDLGPDFTLCDNEFVFPWLSALTFGNGNTVSYEWLQYDISANSWKPWNPPGNAAYERQVTQAGRYSVNVRITDPATGTLLDLFPGEIVVSSVPSPIAHPLENDVYGCDEGTGFFDFDLAALSAKIKGTQTGVTVTYHEFDAFAKLGSDPQTSPYRSSGTKIIWARIENSTGCFDITSFKIIVVPTPTAYEPAPLTFCDTDADSKYLFNLEERTDDILGGQTGLIVTYYTLQIDAELAKFEIFNPNISDPSTEPPPALFATTDAFLSRSQKIWARVEPVLGSGCYAITSFDLEVVAPASANPVENIQKCDDNNDGSFQFDFSSLDIGILGTQDPSIFEVRYFTKADDASDNINALPNPYTNVTPYAEERIYARIQVKNSPDCYDTTSFTIQVFDMAYPAVPANIPNLSYCDDASDGNDTNGFYQFDLNEQEIIILNGQSPYVFEVNYYQDAGFANQILNPATFTNTVANQQTIYVRVKNRHINNVDCNADTSFIVEVKPLPNALSTAYDLIQCDEDGSPDGIVDFNLSEADFFVTIGDNNLNVTYHLSATDAVSGINVVNKSSFSNNVSSTVFARVASANGCYRIVQVNLSVSVTTFPSNYPGRIITICDDDASIDGLHEFNLAQVTSEIISLFPSPNLRVGYYRNQTDALLETNMISPASAYLNEVPFSQTIWARVESAINGNCFGIAPVLKLIVNPRPEFEMDETDVVCLNDLPKTISTYNPLETTYTYEWTDEAGIVKSVKPFAEISEAGVYTVIATSSLGCVSFPKQISVTESIIADISAEDIQIIDNSGNNSITINNANQNLGIGDYEFAFDDITGPYQDDPVFSEVVPGTHIVFVRDKNNCGIAQVTVYVFGFPNFFTPNDDGHNDTWNILGVDPGVFKASAIYIFDRYGKLMANFSAFQLGWDGLYNAHKAVSTDYWYLARMTDLNDETKEYKGHFSLIRR